MVCDYLPCFKGGNPSTIFMVARLIVMIRRISTFGFHQWHNSFHLGAVDIDHAWQPIQQCGPVVVAGPGISARLYTSLIGFEDAPIFRNWHQRAEVLASLVDPVIIRVRLDVIPFNAIDVTGPCNQRLVLAL